MKTELNIEMIRSRIAQLKMEIELIDARIKENLKIQRQLMAPKIEHDVVRLMRM